MCIIAYKAGLDLWTPFLTIFQLYSVFSIYSKLDVCCIFVLPYTILQSGSNQGRIYIRPWSNIDRIICLLCVYICHIYLLFIIWTFFFFGHTGIFFSK